MIYDCFPFFNELELLDIRLHELDSIVDVFVLVEATQTYQGEVKELHFEKNKHLFTKFLPKIKHIVIDFPADLHDQGIPNTPPGPNWWRERYQHDAIMFGLNNCGDDDIIITCDCDEIPRATAIRRYNVLDRVVHLNMKQYSLYLNTLVNEAPWNSGSIQSYWVLKQTTPSHIRNGDRSKAFDNAGWHFSYMGGAQRIVTKLHSFAHDEHRNLHTLESANHMLKGNFSYRIDNELPKYIRDNQEKFQKLGMLFNIPSVLPKETIDSGPYRCAC